MSTAAGPDALVDTSVAVPLVSPDHPDHALVSRAVDGRVLGLAGHAAFESYSVLTRVRPPFRLRPSDAAAALRGSFTRDCFVSDMTAATLVDEMVAVGVDGGAVFDALVGAAAREHGMTLLTRDARAAGTYRALGVTFELIR